MTKAPSPAGRLADIFWRTVALSLAVVLLLLSLGQLGHFLLDTGPDLIAPNGMPIGSDFLSLWSAGWLAATGNPAGAYDQATIFAAHQVAVPANTATTLWHYPPVFLLVVWPLGALPYLSALAVFVLTTLFVFLWLMWQLRPHWSTPLLVMAYPAVWLNILSGQNAFITASLLAAALLALPGRPGLAGLWVGTLTYKPQLGLLWPPALIAGRHWQTILAATVTTVLLGVVSWLAFGSETWVAFLHNLPRPLAVLEDGRLDYARMVSAFSMVRLAGWSVENAYLAQVLSTGLAAVTVLVLWADPRSSTAVRGASLAIATLMGSIHVFHYDLTILTVALLLWLREGEKTRWLAGERVALLAAWLAPVFLVLWADEYRVGLYPMLLLGLQVLLLRRTKVFSSANATN